MSTHSKVIAQTDTHTHKHTDRRTDRHTDTMKTLPLPHMREVIITIDRSYDFRQINLTTNVSHCFILISLQPNRNKAPKCQ